MTDGIEQTARIQGNADHQREVNHAVNQQRQRAVTGHRRDTHFKGNRRSTWRGKQRADSQITHGGQKNTGTTTNRRTQGIHTAANARQCNYRHHRESDRSDHKSGGCPPDVMTCLQANHRRENDISGPDE
ncbi:hypothetical protein D3C80_1400020 [compost metagenome]